MSNETLVHKVTLGSGKIVLLKEMLIKHQELAARASASKVSNPDNKMELALALQNELIKILVIKIDGKEIKPMDMENLDSVFKYTEYAQLLIVIEKITGGKAEMGNFQIELLPSGDK